MSILTDDLRWTLAFDQADAVPVVAAFDAWTATPANACPTLTIWRNGDNHAIRTQRWQYIRYHDGSGELYDHENDANEC